MQVLISYHSDYGNTEKFAQAIAAGISNAMPESRLILKQATDTTLSDLQQADVIFFGSPVHMGSMAWQMKKLIDEGSKLWMEDLLAEKIGGVFATGGGFGNAGGGVEQTLIALHANFLEHGMVVIGFPKNLPGYADGGLQWGAYARTSNHEGMPQGMQEASLTAARSYGAHVVGIAARLA